MKINKKDVKEIWEIISQISDIRSRFNVFDNEERKLYMNCSLAIKALRVVIGEPVEEE